MAGEIFKKHIKENELVAVVQRNCQAAKLIKEYFNQENKQK